MPETYRGLIKVINFTAEINSHFAREAEEIFSPPPAVQTSEGPVPRTNPVPMSEAVRNVLKKLIEAKKGTKYKLLPLGLKL